MQVDLYHLESVPPHLGLWPVLVSYESSHQRKSKMEWNLVTPWCGPSSGHCLALQLSGETLGNDKKEETSTYEDPGLAVGGGPEGMKEKQREQSAWITGQWTCTVKPSPIKVLNPPPQGVTYFSGIYYFAPVPHQLPLQKNIPVRTWLYPAVQGLRKTLTQVLKLSQGDGRPQRMQWVSVGGRVTAPDRNSRGLWRQQDGTGARVR